MRVLHLTRDLAPRSRGGISTAVAGMTAALARRGHRVAVLSFDDWRPRRGVATTGTTLQRTDAGGVAVWRLRHAGHLDDARRVAERFAPDLLHVHHEMLWEWAAELRGRRGSPAILNVHVVQSEMNRCRGIAEETLSRGAQRRALVEADLVLVPSHAAAASLRGAARPCRLRIAPLGVDDDAAVRSIVAERAAGAERRSLLYLGRFDDVKGLPDLLRLVPRLLASEPALRVTVAGGVPGNRRSERRWQEAWVRATPPELRSRLDRPGWLGPADVRACLREAVALLAPSRYETFGLSVLEAMLHGVPVVAYRAGALAELIEHERTGLLSEPGDVNGLQENARRLLRDPERALRMGAAAAARVRLGLLWEHVTPLLVEAYEQAIFSGTYSPALGAAPRDRRPRRGLGGHRSVDADVR